MAITDQPGGRVDDVVEGARNIRGNLIQLCNVNTRILDTIKGLVDLHGAAAIRTELEKGETGDDADMRTIYDLVRTTLQNPAIGKTIPTLPT